MHKIVCCLLIIAVALNSTTLKEVFDRAKPRDGYDKYLELQTGVTYTGGLFSGRYFEPFLYQLTEYNQKSIMIKGNGAILDLQGGQITIAYGTERLDIENCVIINGNIRYTGLVQDDFYYCPKGSVRQVTFYKPHDYAVRLDGTGGDILLEKNLAVNVVATSSDMEPINGNIVSNLITGVSFAKSGYSWFGIPQITRNWSYITGAGFNLIRHFAQLCESG